MSFDKRWVVLAVLSCALFLIVIDMTVLYTALPVLTHELHATASQKLWIVNAYPLVVSGLLLGAGTLGDKLGHRKMFILGLIVFGFASLGAAYSPTPEYLIGFRAMLAVGAAMMMPATLSLIRLTFIDEKEQALAIGIWAAVASGGAALGPIVGGFLLEYFWWGSVFLINVPIVIVSLILTMVLIEKGKGQPERVWDFWGSLQIMVGLVGVTYAVKEAAKIDPSYTAAVFALVLGIIGLWVFVKRQKRIPDPLIDFEIFKNKRFLAAVIAALAVACTLIGMQLVFTQRLQLVLGMSPLQASLFMLPLPLASFISGPLAGWAVPRMGHSKILWYSLLMSGVGMAVYAVSYNAPAFVQMVFLTVIGFGMGAAITASSNAIMTNATEDRAGMAASIEEVSFELGGAMGVTIMGTLMSVVYAASLIVPEGMGVSDTVRDSLDEVILAAETLPKETADALFALAAASFDRAFVAVLILGTILLTAAAIFGRYSDSHAK